MYSEKDIAVVIPTFNRSKDVDRTLGTLLKNNNPNVVYVVDQSHNDLTKNVVAKYSKSYKNLHFIYSSPPSTAKASNIGINKSRDHKLLLMLDDDADCLPGFLQGILAEFNNDPKVFGVGAWISGEERKNPDTLLKTIQKIILNMFLLPSPTNKKFRVIGPYGNTGSYTEKRRIPDAEWLPGVNMCYRMDALKGYTLPEPRGYNLMQDMDPSYYIFRRKGKGSIIITDKAQVNHRYSQVERYDDYKRAFVSQEDRFIFRYRYFNNPSGTIMAAWSIFGLILLKTSMLIISPKKENFLSLKYFIQSLGYCIKNRKNIKSGKYRQFLNEDLSFKEN